MDSETIYRRRWATLFVLSLSLVIIGLDNTILNVALPTLVRELGASASQLQWMVDSYVLVFAGLLLTMGALGDRFGRKLALNVGLVVFGLSSIAAAFADSANTLIAARSVMGIGGALIMPATLSIITNVFKGPERGRAIAAWAAVAGLGIILGPVLGGWLLENFWWGSIFLINVLVVTVAIGAGAVLVPESKDPDATPLDPLGAVLSIAGLVSLVYAIIEAPSRGWTDPLVMTMFGLAAVLIAVFLWWETRTEHPMLQLSFFENPRFSAASVAITLVFFAMFGTVFLNTQYLQFVLGFSPLEAGFRVMPVATMIVAAPLSARFAERFGTKRVVTTGLVIVGVAMSTLASITVDTGYGRVAIALAILGAGMGTAMAPATESIMGSLPLAKAGVGSAMNDTTRQIGGALGVAILGSILASSYSAAMAPVVANLPGEAAQIAGNSIGGAVAVASQIGEAGARLVDSASAAFIGGMEVAVWVAAGVVLLGALITYLFLPARPPEWAQTGTIRVDDAH
ncbi:MAG TPA: DHA2 family efflux MFS transporter permease subunit [Acidimicrobiia bacterium]|nr:DHA2 family efflux MFS transporter permease subunit [Acidimicrobiia bacterium]